SESRVDFRELVKNLANIFRVRIELRQIGVRDEARMLGGHGPCGRRLCCMSFLKDFNPVTIKMAKTQNLPLNPSKISGLCGRLMCCLGYEYEHYKECSKNMPRIGREVKTKYGAGRIVGVNPLKRFVAVDLGEGKIKDISVCEVECPKDKIKGIPPILNRGKRTKEQKQGTEDGKK
ncbi:MAG: regulatory iron-sulfur-containing complex subunit RicT, partial [Candidatus Omnitrophota bacterium]